MMLWPFSHFVFTEKIQGILWIAVVQSKQPPVVSMQWNSTQHGTQTAMMITVVVATTALMTSEILLDKEIAVDNLEIKL